MISLRRQSEAAGRQAGRERASGSDAAGQKESEFTQQQGGEIKDDFYFLYLRENSLPGRGARAERCQPRKMTCLTDRETHTQTHKTHTHTCTVTLHMKCKDRQTQHKKTH